MGQHAVSMERIFIMLAGVGGLTGVATGAFGAHALDALFSSSEDGVARSGWWDTAAQYHLVHALAIGLAAYLVSRSSSRAPVLAGWAFAVGVLLFSGSLYTMALTGLRTLGMVTPIGGTLLLVGWGALVVAGHKAASPPRARGGD